MPQRPGGARLFHGHDVALAHNVLHCEHLQRRPAEGCGGEEGDVLRFQQAVVERVLQRVRDPLRDHDGHEEREKEVHLVGHLHDDDGEGEGEARHARHVRASANHRPHARVDPLRDT